MKIHFADITEEFTKKETSKIAIIPVNNKIDAFFKASKNINLYDIESENEVYKQGIHTTDYIVDTGLDHESISTKIHDQVKSLLNTKKFIAIIAEEHFTAIGSIKAFNEHYENLTVLHIDSHARLYKQVNGKKIANDCAMYHASQTTNLIQVGVRSMSHIETTVLDTGKTFFAHDLAKDDYWIENVSELLTENVLISFHLNGLDTSIMPAVDKPLPGGLFWYETLDFLQSVFAEKNIVGVNLLGLKSIENNKAPDALAATLLYKILNYKFEKEE